MDVRTTPRYARWASGTSDKSLARAIKDQARIIAGRLNATNATTRYTEAGLSRSHYDQLRYQRGDLDFREWNESTGFSGIDRRPTGPGMPEEGRRRRGAERKRIDDGF
ncbi:MAG: hypothetical protein H6746_17355 [Deltaproteobacteria bacterium]|nr:hypothetical protein [Deltaproteobacteria bacterium]